MADPTTGTYVVDQTACVNGTSCSLMFNLDGPLAVPTTAFCQQGGNISSNINDALFGTDSETRYPGDVCVQNTTTCYGNGYCLNGVCMAANPSVGAPCQATGDCNLGQYCDQRS